MPGAVTVAAFIVRLFGTGDEPQADWNLRDVEELARHRHHAIDHIRVNYCLADVASGQFQLPLPNHFGAETIELRHE